MSPRELFQNLDSDTVKSRTRGAMMVSMAAQGGTQVMQFAAFAVLGRLLSPDDFGLIAMATVASNFIVQFKDAGLSQATIQRDTVNEAQISTIFWINCALTLVLGLSLLSLSPAIAWVYGDPRLTAIAASLAVPMALSGTSLQHRALLARRMDFGRIARAELLGTALGIATGICGALNDWAYWSIIAMIVARELTTTVLLWVLSAWIPRRPSRLAEVRSMLHFGLNLTGFGLVNYFNRNADDFLIGRVSGPAALGQYSMAYRFLMLPLQLLNAPLAQVLLPTLSRYRDDPSHFEASFLGFLRIVAWLTIIPIACTCLVGEDLIVMILGSEWREAGQLFSILAIASMLQPVGNLCGQLFLAVGATRPLFRWGIFSMLVNVSGFLIGIRWGASGVAWAYAICTLGLTPPYWWYCCRHSGLSLGPLINAMKWPCLIGMSIVAVYLYRL